jgi:histidinol-phosphate aminotransferase
VHARSPRFRTILDRLIPAWAGPGRAAPPGEAIRLAANESPFGPLPSVADAIAAAGATVNRYPDPTAVTLTRAIADRYGVPPGHVVVGAGSSGVIQALLAAAAEPGTEVLYAWRSFEAYPPLVALTGASQVRVPLREHRHDLAAMAAAITLATRVIFICNPNNPTGTVVRHDELARFLDQVPGDCLVVLDEAYAEYVRGPAADGLALYREHPNVAVLRTFSKAYGLAGLRVGFMVGHETVARAVAAAMMPFTVNTVAQAAALASLAAEPELLERVELVVSERSRVRAELLAQSWQVPPTDGNFLWLPAGGDALDFAAGCQRAGISVRAFDGEGARVTLGGKQANDALLAAAKAYPRRH